MTKKQPTPSESNHLPRSRRSATSLTAPTAPTAPKPLRVSPARAERGTGLHRRPRHPDTAGALDLGSLEGAPIRGKLTSTLVKPGVALQAAMPENGSKAMVQTSASSLSKRTEGRGGKHTGMNQRCMRAPNAQPGMKGRLAPGPGPKRKQRCTFGQAAHRQREPTMPRNDVFVILCSRWPKGNPFPFRLFSF